MNPSDTERIVLLILRGDIDAYAEIVRGYGLEVWKVVAAMLLDMQKTEDLVQQTFIQAYQQLHRFEPGRPFGPWIKQIARNIVRQEIRHRLREEHRLGLYYNHWLQMNESDTASAVDEVLAATLERCTRELPPESARLIELRYHQALSFDQIAAQIGRTVEAARQHLSRIRLALRDCIQRYLARI